MSPMDVSISTADAATATSVLAWAQGQAKGFDPPVIELGAQPSYRMSYATFPFTAQTPWVIAAGSAVSLPYGSAPSTQSLRTWQLPESLVNVPHAPASATMPPLPCFDVRAAKVDEATGASVVQPVGNYGWATQIGVTIKLLPALPPTPSAATTYELVGANEYDIVLLERLLNAIGLDKPTEQSIAQMLLLHGVPGGGSGLASDGDALTTFIAQSNLSTVTNPPGGRGFMLMEEAPVPGGAQKPGDFVRLLWECSITRSGGYYLYYSTDKEKHTGLPSALFNDKGEAELTLLVIYGAQGTQVANYVNAAVTSGYIDPSAEAVYAQALPQPAQVQAAASDSLESLADTYRMTPQEVAEANTGVTVAAQLTVNGGSYQVPTVAAGDPNAIAALFGTSVAALTAANPTLDFTKAIPQWSVVKLPDGLTVAPGTKTLADVAAAYGVTVDMLAAANAPQTNIFGTSPIVVAALVSDPSAHSLADLAEAYYMDPVQLAEDNAAVPLSPGAQVLANGGFYEVPGGAGAGALDAIAARFGINASLIQQANPTLDWTNPQPPMTIVMLPAALTLQAGTSPGSGSLGAIAAFYAIPVARLALDNATTAGLYNAALRVRGGPLVRQAASPPGVLTFGMERVAPTPGATDPESYLERLYDLLSYRVPDGLTGFSPSTPGPPLGPRTAPSGPSGDKVSRPTNDGIMRYQRGVPYSSVATPRPGSAGANLPDPNASPYLGVGKLLRLKFGWNDMFGNCVISPLSDPALDPASPLNMPSAMALYTDPIVGLSEWPSIGYDYSFANGNSANTIELTINLGFDACTYITDGSAGCPKPDPNSPPPVDPEKRAEHDLKVYERIWYQLAAVAGGGLDVTVSTSLLSKAQPVDSAPLLAFAGEIYSWLRARAGGTIGTVPTFAPITIPVDLTVNPAEIFELTVDLAMSRPSALVDPDLELDSKVAQNSTAVPAQHARDASGTYSLVEFASTFEAAAQAAGVGVKVAIGVDRRTVERATGSTPLWVVRTGAPGTPLSISVTAPTAPLVYATRPISNVLRSGTFDLRAYGTGTGLSSTTAPAAFASIDLDTWSRQLLGAVDHLLSPAYATAIGLIDSKMTSGQPNLEQLAGAKEGLAAALKTLAIPVTGDAGDGLTAAQATLEQEMLEQLESYYAVDAIVQFPVVASSASTDPKTSAQLYGNLKQTGTSTQPVSLSSPKIPLANPAPGPTSPTLTFLLSTASGALDIAATEPCVPLTLGFEGTNVEHQISPLPGIEGYTASSWLSFVTGTPAGFEAALGEFEVPLILHGFPTPPAMQAQSGPQTTPDGTDGLTLEETLSWDYELTYAESVHYPQDTIHLTIEFNHAPGGSLSSEALASVDPMPALAQFAYVYEAVQADLDTYVGLVDPGKLDPSSQPFKNATVALATFVGLATAVAATITGIGQGDRERGLGAAIPEEQFDLSIAESAAPLTSKIDPSQSVEALIVTVEDKSSKPLGVQAAVDIDGYTRVTPPPGMTNTDTQYCYAYLSAATPSNWLPAQISAGSAIAGETIPARKVTLPGMNVLARQDAWASAWIGRNESAAPPFRYSTPPVYFTSPQYPTNVYTSPSIYVEAIGESSPTARKPEDHLSALFQALFANAPAGTQKIQLECRYDYTLPNLLPVSLPVSLLPPTSADPTVDLKVPDGGCPVDSTLLVCQLGSVMRTWWLANQPSTMNGYFTLDLTVMSQLTNQPLIRLENLVLTEQYVQWS